MLPCRRLKPRTTAMSFTTDILWIFTGCYTRKCRMINEGKLDHLSLAWQPSSGVSVKAEENRVPGKRGLHQPQKQWL